MTPKKDREFDFNFTRYLRWGVLATGIAAGFLLLMSSTLAKGVLDATNLVATIGIVELIYVFIYYGLIESKLTRFLKGSLTAVFMLGFLTFFVIELFNIIIAFDHGQPYYSSQFRTNFWINRIVNALISWLINGVVYCLRYGKTSR